MYNIDSKQVFDIQPKHTIEELIDLTEAKEYIVLGEKKIDVYIRRLYNNAKFKKAYYTTDI